MASTYSALKIELIATGEQTGTWGSTTNTNLSTALGEAITGSADVAFSSADVTVTLTDTNAAQTARNLRLNLTGTSGGARQLILGSGCQIEKLYLINNGLLDAVTVKNTAGTGIAVPAGRSMFLYNDGTNVVAAVTAVTALTATDLTDSSLTSGRVVYATTGGNLIDSANLTFDGTILTAATLVSTGDATVNGIRVGEGGGNVATNTALGASTLAVNTTGANNVAVGAGALDVNTIGSQNTAVGANALGSNLIGNNNVAIGYQAL